MNMSRSNGNLTSGYKNLHQPGRILDETGFSDFWTS